MRKLSTLIALFFAAMLAVAGFSVPARAAEIPNPAEDTVAVTVIQTTDVHARIFPWDYLADKPDNVGLAKVATYVRHARTENPNVLLIDNGDTIQGTPLGYYFAVLDPKEPHPMITAMNAMGYDAMTVGNHEYNYGLTVLERCRKEARFPMLSANTYRIGEATPFFKPYIIKDISGIRIAVLGLTTPAIPGWELPDNYKGLEFRDTVAEARKWIAVLRDQEKVDAVIVDIHEGFEADLDTGRPNDSAFENHAWALLQEVPGIDVLLTGHAHQNIPPRPITVGEGNTRRTVLVAQGHRWGAHITRVDLVFHREDGHWKLTAKSGLNPAMDASVPPDPEIERLGQPCQDKVLAWLHQEIGTAGSDFTTRTIYTEDNALMDLVHTAVLRYTGAQMSLLSYLPGRYITLTKGPLTVRDIYSFYFYENTAVKLAIKGKDLLAALEHAADFYDAEGWNAEAGAFRLAPGPEFRLYNFSTLAGASYAVDPTRPKGHRITHFLYQGRPIEPETEYTLAVSNYQAAGGGAYDMLRNGRWLPLEAQDIRSLVIRYIQEQKTVDPVCDYNWYLAFPCRLDLPNRR
jgi:2',3'-cyclic-nucleotide 2'-phosphodiesterase/3'-nucleotidase